MSTISASTTSNTAFKVTSDTTGTLVFQTGAVPTTAISISASQVVSIGNIAVTGATTFAAGSAAAPSITTTGDTNTGLFFPAADTIAFTEGGAESMRIDAAANVGIGVTPSALDSNYKGLQVGNAAFLISGNNQFASFTEHTANAFFDTASTYKYKNTGFATKYRQNDGAHSWSIAASGTAGNAITFTQAMTLDANSNLSVTGAGNVDVKITGSAGVPSLTFVNGAGTQYIAGGVGGSNNIVFYPNSTERMRLDSSGNLGIGTSSPLARLDVFKTSNDTVSRTNAVGAFGDYASLGAGLLMQQALSSPYGFTLQAANAANSVQFPLLLNPSGGNVGIGTTSPSTFGKLAILSTGTSTTVALVNSSSSSASNTVSTDYFLPNSFGGLEKSATIGAINPNAGGNNGGVLYFSTSSNGTATTPTERARITAAGALLVGTTSPFSGNSNTFNSVGVTFDDWGVVSRHTASNQDVRCVLASAPNYSGNDGYFFIGNRSTGDRIYIRTSGDIANTNGTYGTISDQRLKQDIVDAPSQWNDLKAVRFRKYRLKDDVQADSNAPALLGVIAQELEQVCPGLVQGDELKTVKSSILLMKAAVALQEAMTRIEQLEAKFAALESK